MTKHIIRMTAKDIEEAVKNFPFGTTDVLDTVDYTIGETKHHTARWINDLYERMAIYTDTSSCAGYREIGGSK